MTFRDEPLFADFEPTFAVDKPKFEDHAEGSVGWIIVRYVNEMNGWDGSAPVRELGDSHRYTLQKIASSKLGLIKAEKLRKQDVIDYMRALQGAGLCAASCGQYFTYLNGALKYAGSAWDDCEEISAKALTDAKPFLVKHQLIGKSTPRDRRPTDQEIDRLLAFFGTRVERSNTIPMGLMTAWQIASARRVGESCALLWIDWNPEDRTILVRKMKDPKRKNKQKVVALTVEAQDMLLEMAYALNDAGAEARNSQQERIFPYEKKSVSAAFTLAKKKLDIKNLRLHDCRRECASRLAEKGYNSNQIRLVTGHETNAILDRTYNRPDPTTFKDIRLEQPR